MLQERAVSRSDTYVRTVRVRVRDPRRISFRSRVCRFAVVFGARGGDCEPWHVIVPRAAATPSRGEDEARQPPRRQDATRIAGLLLRHRDGHPRPGRLAGERQAEDVRPAR